MDWMRPGNRKVRVAPPAQFRPWLDTLAVAGARLFALNACCCWPRLGCDFKHRSEPKRAAAISRSVQVASAVENDRPAWILPVRTADEAM